MDTDNTRTDVEQYEWEMSTDRRSTRPGNLEKDISNREIAEEEEEAK